MGFAERNGFLQEKAIQIDDMDRALGNRLYNEVHKFSESSSFVNEELEEVSSATHSPYESVSTHFKKALSLYSDRKSPDYENSIKESISAVEAMCCIITGATGSQATLGNTLKKLEINGVVIHSVMKAGFEKMYGYTSDADGIRHGGIDFTNAPAEDAKYMLISCSTFVNYLIEKFSKVN